MYHNFDYEATLASSLRAQWKLDDVLREEQDLDFSRSFMPESLARTAAVTSLNPFEQRILNHISAHQYLSIFGIVEEFILPFVVDHAEGDASRGLRGSAAHQGPRRAADGARPGAAVRVHPEPGVSARR